MMRRGFLLTGVGCCLLMACHEKKTPEQVVAPVAQNTPTVMAPTPTTVQAPKQRFGMTVPETMPLVTLDTLLASPQEYSGKQIKTSGTIHRVCQSMGCWMELESESGKHVRVPMAGHDFFVPKDASGKKATVVGEFIAEKLSDQFKEHLKAEGATQLDAKVSLSALGVIIEGKK